MFAVGAVTAYQSYIFFRLWLNDPSGLTEESKAQRRVVLRWQQAGFLVGTTFFTLFIPAARTLVLIVLLTSVGWELIRTDKAWTASDWIMVTTCLLISAFFLYARMIDLTIAWDCRSIIAWPWPRFSLPIARWMIVRSSTDRQRQAIQVQSDLLSAERDLVVLYGVVR